jgi:hypothetical protein
VYPGRPKGLEPQHRTDDPFDAVVVLFHHMGEILDLMDFDRRAVRLAVPSEGGGIGLAPIDRDLPRANMARTDSVG